MELEHRVVNRQKMGLKIAAATAPEKAAGRSGDLEARGQPVAH